MAIVPHVILSYRFVFVSSVHRVVCNLKASVRQISKSESEDESEDENEK